MSNQHTSDGVAAVEMAVVLLFLIPLVIGIIDVSQLIYSHISIQEAAQEGAFLAAFEEDTTVANIESRVEESTPFPDLSGANTTIHVWCDSDVPRSMPSSVVEVTVTHELELLLPFTGSASISKTAAADRFFADCP